MKWLAWGSVFVLWAAACATTEPIEASDVPTPPSPEAAPPPADAGTDVRAEASVKPEAGGGDSSFVAPAPIVSAMTPLKATAGGVGPTLVVTGDKFVSWSVVRVDGADLPTTFVSQTKLQAQLPASRIDNAGILQIDVFTAAPGGGKSANLGFLVENPIPVLASIAPSSVQVGSGDMILTLNGTNFSKSPKVTFDNVDLVIQSVTANVLTATVPAALVAVAGSRPVTVANPAPGGGKSSTIAFIVTNPQAITVTGVSPTTALVGSGNVTLTIAGAGFVQGSGGSGSSVSFNGVNIPTTVTDQTQMSATIPAALLTTSGTFPIVVTNPPPGGGVSSPVTFEVQNPAPSITKLQPNTAFYGGSDKKISVLGTGFVPQSVVRVANTDVTTTFVSGNELEALVPAPKLAALGTLGIHVHSPGPGGGDSATSPLLVVCDPSGVDVALGAAGDVTTVFTSFSTAPTAPPLNAGVCPTSLATTRTPQPYRTWVVQNNQPQSLTLSAWAVCSTGTLSEDDALLAIYKRPTPPATDGERLQCATVMSEGSFGSYPAGATYKSPESNGSSWCPGLTKANGGGVALAACEKAVVFTMPYDASSIYYTPPYALRLKVE